MAEIEWHSGLLFNMLKARHPNTGGQWALVGEMGKGTGARAGGWIDAAAFNLWPSNHYRRIAYEIKVARNDFMRELDDPKKRAYAEDYFHESWFVAPPGIIKEEELPEGWGLLQATKNAKQLRRVRAAQQRKDPKLDNGMLSAAIRSVTQKTNGIEAQTYTIGRTSFSHDEFNAFVSSIVRKAVAYQYDDAARLRTKYNELLEKLGRQQQRLAGGLKRLEQLASDRGRWGASHTIDYGSEEVTAEMVDAWVAQAAMHKLQNNSRLLTSAHELLGELVSKLQDGTE